MEPAAGAIEICSRDARAKLSNKKGLALAAATAAGPLNRNNPTCCLLQFSISQTGINLLSRSNDSQGRPRAIPESD